MRMEICLVYRCMLMGLLLLSGMVFPAEAVERSHRAVIRYAQWFSIDYEADHKIIRVHRPGEDAGIEFEYLLIPRGAAPPPGHERAQVVEVPVKNLVSMSITNLGFLNALNLTRYLVGIGNFKYVNTPEIRRMIDRKAVLETGKGMAVNMEMLMAARPELIFHNNMSGVGNVGNKLVSAGFKVAFTSDYLESHPLARCEWIKFVAAFFNQEKIAEEIFSDIEKRYREMAGKVRHLEKRPTVLTGAPYSGHWWVAGGESYLAAYLKDAGACYLWSDTAFSSSKPMAVEAVYQRALSADFWLNTGTWKAMADALKADGRFNGLPALKSGHIYNNNARLNEFGGNDYWESGMIRPDVILADMICIFHPEVLPDHELVYYRKLK